MVIFFAPIESTLFCLRRTKFFLVIFISSFMFLIILIVVLKNICRVLLSGIHCFQVLVLKYIVHAGSHFGSSFKWDYFLCVLGCRSVCQNSWCLLYPGVQC